MNRNEEILSRAIEYADRLELVIDGRSSVIVEKGMEKYIAKGFRDGCRAKQFLEEYGRSLKKRTRQPNHKTR